MEPVPAGASKVGIVRCHDTREGEFDAELIAAWIRQAVAQSQAKL